MTVGAHLLSWVGAPAARHRGGVIRSVSCAALSVFTGYMAAEALHMSLTGGYDRVAPFPGWKTGPPALVLLLAVATLLASRRKSSLWAAAANLLALATWFTVSVFVGGG